MPRFLRQTCHLSLVKSDSCQMSRFLWCTSHLSLVKSDSSKMSNFLWCTCHFSLENSDSCQMSHFLWCTSHLSLVKSDSCQMSNFLFHTCQNTQKSVTCVSFQAVNFLWSFGWATGNFLHIGAISFDEKVVPKISGSSTFLTRSNKSSIWIFVMNPKYLCCEHHFLHHLKVVIAQTFCLFHLPSFLVQ